MELGLDLRCDKLAGRVDVRVLLDRWIVVVPPSTASTWRISSAIKRVSPDGTLVDDDGLVAKDLLDCGTTMLLLEEADDTDAFLTNPAPAVSR